MTSTEEMFRIWNYFCSSGAGSDPDRCKSYVEFVSRFIRERGVQSVLDLGCGDFAVGCSIDYGDARVSAVDASSWHIDRLTEKYKNDPRFAFGRTDIQRYDMSDFDLVLVKDVLQHWKNGDISEWLARPRPRFLLLTNDTLGPLNGDVDYGPAVDGRYTTGVRSLDLNASPFDAGGEVVFEFAGKKTLLLERE